MLSSSEAVVRLFGLVPSAVAPPPPPLRANHRPPRPAAFLSLSPADPVLLVGGVVALQARLVLTDLSGLDVTQDAVWTSSAPAVARFETSPGRRQRGHLTALAPGVADLFASAGGKVGWTTVTVLEG